MEAAQGGLPASMPEVRLGLFSVAQKSCQAYNNGVVHSF
jgi:hypothetical protein